MVCFANLPLCYIYDVIYFAGMVGAMVRHLISLRRFKRDQGWIHTLLEEAENERMHLMTAMRIANPGFIMKAAVVGAQGNISCVFLYARH